MKVGDIATKPAVTCRPTASISDAARSMRETNVGALVVVDEEQRPIGIVTDRDLVIRGLARELPPSTAVRELMPTELLLASEDNDAAQVLHKASGWGCRRIPVVSAHGTVVGMVTLDDLTAQMAESMAEIAQAEREARRRR